MKLAIGARIAIGTALTLATLAVLHHKPWRDDRAPPPLTPHRSRSKRVICTLATATSAPDGAYRRARLR